MGDAFTTTLLIPVLNEIDGLRAIMPRVRREWVDQILIVDGGSTDGSIEYALEHGYELHRQQAPGIRSGYLEALGRITGDVLVTFSPDGNSVPEVIPPLLAKMAEGYDMVIASRYLGGRKSEDDDVITAFGNWLFTRTANLLHGGHYTDMMVIFRAYRTALIGELGLDRPEPYALPERLFHTRISWEPLLSVRAARAKWKVGEIYGPEPPRIGGERKLQLVRWGAAYYWQILREVFGNRPGWERARRG
ncbi:MAG TPA: glycosyltransferase family 2 protein [Phycisphaerae bacterium]|nr:glycosyltransferase family 2 protein [Phycisphaerae bacterium]